MVWDSWLAFSLRESSFNVVVDTGMNNRMIKRSNSFPNTNLPDDPMKDIS
jgi:hypothetical protein